MPILELKYAVWVLFGNNAKIVLAYAAGGEENLTVGG